jgi:hypothetical protein
MDVQKGKRETPLCKQSGVSGEMHECTYNETILTVIGESKNTCIRTMSSNIET